MKAYFDSIKNALKLNYLYVCVGALAFLLIFVCAYYNTDPDFGWHLASGKYIITNGIPARDIFTYTASNFPWINHEWLNDALIARLYETGGYLLTATVFSALWMAGLITAQRLRVKFVLLVSTLAIMPFSGIRPVVWTVVLIAVLERLIISNKKSLQFIIPTIFVLWANLHGSFILGLAILTLYQLFSKNKIAWAAFVMSFLAVFINPYGYKIFEEIIRTAADSQLRFRISEWRPLLLPYISIAYIILFASLHLSIAKRPWKKVLSIPGLALAMTLSSIRHLPVFVITSIRYFEKYTVDLLAMVSKIKKTEATRIIIAVSLTCLWILIAVSSIVTVRGSIHHGEYYPSKAVTYLESSKCKGNIFNSYNFGGYLIWKLPNSKVYIDGRMPSWKYQGQDYFADYTNFLNKDEFRLEQTRKNDIRCILLTKQDALQKNRRYLTLNEQLRREGWDYIEKGSSSEYYLFIKS